MAVKESSKLSRMFSETAVIAGVVVGILLIWIYSLLAPFSLGANVLNTIRALKQTGITLVSMMLISGGIVSTRDERNIRAVMIVMGALILLMQALWWT
jgi:hypothetical protein